jgi:hypothetical protein
LDNLDEFRGGDGLRNLDNGVDVENGGVDQTTGGGLVRFGIVLVREGLGFGDGIGGGSRLLLLGTSASKGEAVGRGGGVRGAEEDGVGRKMKLHDGRDGGG